MKITLATGLYPPEIGGPATHSQLLEEHLPRERFSITVVPFGRVRGTMKFFRHIAYTYHLIKESKDAELIYALDPVSVGLPAYIASVFRRTPLIVRVAGDYAWEQGQQRYGVRDPLDVFVHNTSRYSLWVRVLSFFERFVAKRAAQVVVPSAYLKRIVKIWGVPDDHLQVIYSVFQPNEIEESADELREMFKYDEVVLVSVGRLVRWKGFSTLIELLPELQEEIGKSVTLVIIGDGPDRSAIEARAAEVGISDKVRFTGRQSRGALLAAIKGADLFVLNTGYEGLSHQLLEVMDIGTPIVTTNVGGNPELIENEKHGLLVPYDDRVALKRAIERILADETLRDHMVSAARTRAAEFTVDRMVTALCELFIKYERAEKETYQY